MVQSSSSVAQSSEFCSPIFISAETTRRVLTFPDVIAALRAAYSIQHGPFVSPPRVVTRADGDWLRALAAAPPKSRFMGAKVFGFGRAKTVGLISLFDQQTGALAALIDANLLRPIGRRRRRQSRPTSLLRRGQLPSRFSAAGSRRRCMRARLPASGRFPRCASTARRQRIEKPSLRDSAANSTPPAFRLQSPEEAVSGVQHCHRRRAVARRDADSARHMVA